MPLLLLGAAGCCWALLGAAGCCWVLVAGVCIACAAIHALSHVGLGAACWVLLGAAELGLCVAIRIGGLVKRCHGITTYKEF